MSLLLCLLILSSTLLSCSHPASLPSSQIDMRLDDTVALVYYSTSLPKEYYNKGTSYLVRMNREGAIQTLLGEGLEWGSPVKLPNQDSLVIQRKHEIEVQTNEAKSASYTSPCPVSAGYRQMSGYLTEAGNIIPCSIKASLRMTITSPSCAGETTIITTAGNSRIRRSPGQRRTHGIRFNLRARITSRAEPNRHGASGRPADICQIPAAGHRYRVSDRTDGHLICSREAVCRLFHAQPGQSRQAAADGDRHRFAYGQRLSAAYVWRRAG